VGSKCSVVLRACSAGGMEGGGDGGEWLSVNTRAVQRERERVEKRQEKQRQAQPQFVIGNEGHFQVLDETTFMRK
jgi:hypothetical protein